MSLIEERLREKEEKVRKIENAFKEGKSKKDFIVDQNIVGYKKFT